jgi:hypothetical protein
MDSLILIGSALGILYFICRDGSKRDDTRHDLTDKRMDGMEARAFRNESLLLQQIEKTSRLEGMATGYLMAKQPHRLGRSSRGGDHDNPH